MPQYAQFDPAAPSPQPIIGWYDTDVLTYPNLPPSAALLEVTAAQFLARLENPGAWANNDGALIGAIVSTPAPTLPEQAGALLMAGLTISLSGSITQSPTVFPTDPQTQSKLIGVMSTLNATGSFPGGVDSFQMKDMDGVWHPFSIAQYTAVAAAISAFAATLLEIIDGNPSVTALPSTSVALTV